jgi:hypothetical protein
VNCVEQNGQRLIALLIVNFAQSLNRVRDELATVLLHTILWTGDEGFPGGRGGAIVGSLKIGAKAKRGQHRLLSCRNAILYRWHHCVAVLPH